MPQLELRIYDDGLVSIRTAGEDWTAVAQLGKLTSERREGGDRTIYTFEPTDRELGDILQALCMARGDDLHWSIKPAPEAEPAAEAEGACPECGAALEGDSREERVGLDEYQRVCWAVCPACGWMSEPVAEDDFDDD